MCCINIIGQSVVKMTVAKYKNTQLTSHLSLTLPHHKDENTIAS